MNNKSILAMILAGGEGSRLNPLTEQRAKPAVPFGGKFRIIDFVLSNFINSGIHSIFVLTQFKSQSLTEHIINGWNTASSQGPSRFVVPVPAQMQTEDRHWYAGTADAIAQNVHLIEDFMPDLVAVFGGDHIYKMDVSQMAKFHNEKDALVTVSAIPVPKEEASAFGVIQVDENWKIVGFQEKPKEPTTIPGNDQMALVSMGNYIFESENLIELLHKDANNPESSHDFGKDILPTLVDTGRLYAYNFKNNELPGQKEATEKPYWKDVGNLAAYYTANMDLKATEPMLDLYNEKWPIYNYNTSLPPAKFVHNETAEDGTPRVGEAINSIVCDGCIVSGSKVVDSILYNSVRVNSYARVEDSLLMDNVIIGENCKIKNAIIDKHNTIPPNTTIGFNREEDEKHFKVVDLDEEKGSWLVVIPKKRKQTVALPNTV